MYGYMGKILRVDLTRGEVKVEEVKEGFYRKFIGGAGLAAKIIFDEVGPGVDPLSPENRLVFAVGPYQGTRAPGSGRWIAAARSPLTGIWADSCAGGAWGPEFKKTGFDALIVQGRAEKPVYIWIKDGEVEIRDASHFWGMDSYEAHDAIIKELGEPKAKVATIGQAGENLVRIACIMSDKHAFAGRCGLGAVMGSKNLKAVAVRGTKEVEVAEPGKLEELCKELYPKIAEGAAAFGAHGTPFYMPVGYELMGDVPVKYWSQGEFISGIMALGAPRYTEKIFVKKEPCLNCPIGCHRYIKVEKPEKYACEGAGPEYEAIAMFGTNCLVDSLEAVAKANDLCNRYGLDVISAGALVGFAMECYENGWITKNDTGGIELKWGDGDAVVAMVEKIALRKDLGDVLAEGIKRAAEKIGKGAPDIIVHVKGLDIPAHDPRAHLSMAINYATGTRGACHERADPFCMELGLVIPEFGLEKPTDRRSWVGQAFATIKYQDLEGMCDCLIQCKFMAFGGCTVTDKLNLLNAITGWNMSMEEFAKTCERVFNLQRAFDVRMGVSRKDDTLPYKMFKPVHPKHSLIALEPMLNEYYKLRGWDPDGKPTREKLVELGLEDVARVLYG